MPDPPGKEYLIYQEVDLEHLEDELPELQADFSDDDADDLEDYEKLLVETRALATEGVVEVAQVAEGAPVVDDFIRNFLTKHGGKF